MVLDLCDLILGRREGLGCEVNVVEIGKPSRIARRIEQGGHVLVTEEERERERLRYIQERMSWVKQYARGGEQAFFREPIVQDAVLQRLETLADATNKLSAALKERHPEIPRAAGLRLPSYRPADL